MKLSIIGTGHVGLVTGACLAERGHDVLSVDIDEKKIRRLRSLQLPIFEPGLEALVVRNIRRKRLRFGTSNAEAVAHGKAIFICVPTPPTPSGRADLSYLEGVSREIGRAMNGYRLIVEKSTVPVRTGERVKSVLAQTVRPGVEFDVASNPEFLREGSAVEDTLRPDRIVLGVETRRSETLLREVYRPFGGPVLVTNIKSAELIKHASNSFLALKISYANALAEVCERSGASVTDVARGVGMDARIGPRFLSAGIGYGGSCFPKDVLAFEALSTELGYDFALLREVRRINSDARERFIRMIQEELWILKGKTIAAWGLAFKPDTDDLRESVSVAVVQRLIAAGAKVRVYDPKAMEKARPLLPEATFTSSALEAATGAECVLLLTEWDEFRRPNWPAIRRQMILPTVIDGRNLYDPRDMKALGFRYRSVGRPEDSDARRTIARDSRTLGERPSSKLDLRTVGVYSRHTMDSVAQ